MDHKSRSTIAGSFSGAVRTLLPPGTGKGTGGSAPGWTGDADVSMVLPRGGGVAPAEGWPPRAENGLLVISGAAHGALGGLLGRIERGLDRDLADERGRDVLAHLRSDGLELGDGHELDAGVRDRLRGRMGGISREDRLERQLGEGGRGLVLLLLVGGLPGAGRDRGPAVRRRDELDVLLRRGPLDELLPLLDVLRRGGDSQGPGPEPLRAIRHLADRRGGEAQAARHLRLLGVREIAGRHGRVDPHGALAGGEEGTVLVVTVGAPARRTVLLHHVHVERDGLLPLGARELRLPLLVEPAATEGVHP